ncbi:MAG: UDP-N-acetylmuramate dehydrogenase [Zetaproteobacteria bacterium]|nr:MAG: UDP-N-acetylmuramate dehydrogenase [Zetaproteobacteria bacterium]
MGWPERLRALGALRQDEPMAAHATLGIGGPARWYFRPDSAEALCRALALLPPDLPRLPLGRGSNLLVVDEGFDGVVLDLDRLDRMEVEGTRVRCGAGVRMSALSARCVEEGLAGVEFMATVPGEIGGAVAMNAGAFGQQLSDCVTEVELAAVDGTRRRVDRSALGFAYRTCRLPAGAVVLSATFRLRPDRPEQIRRRIRDMRARRGASQPLSLPNCGSVFRNPEGDYAARLIEAAGLRGHRIGRAEISSQHANFIVNLGGARSADVLALMELARERVEERFGIRLEPELRVVGGRA